jgi:hypothetical protein
MRMRCSTAVMFFVFLVGAPASTPGYAQQPSSPLKVFCFTPPAEAGFVDKSSQGRADSLKDLKESIAKKKDWLELVEAASQADVTVEVLDRQVVSAGRTAARVSTHTDSKGKTVTTRTESRPINNYMLRTVMRAGSYQNEMTGVVSSESAATWAGQWRSAAGQIAGEIEKWAKANLARLRSRHPPAM